MIPNLLIFLIGAILQSFRYVGSTKDFLLLSGTMGLALVALIPGKSESNYDLIWHVSFYIVLFIALAAFVFKKKVLPRISELTIIVITTIFLYSLIKFFNSNLSTFEIWHMFFMIPSLGFLFFLIFRIHLNSVFKFFFYVWFLIMNVVLITIQLFNGHLISLLENALTFDNAISLVLFGMVSFYLGANILYALLIIPFPSKYTPYSQRIKEAKEHILLLSDSFSGKQLPPLVAFGVLAGLIIILMLNIRFKLISDIILINGILLASQFIPKIIWKT